MRPASSSDNKRVAHKNDYIYIIVAETSCQISVFNIICIHMMRMFMTRYL